MKKNSLYILLFLVPNLLFAQKLHVKYKNIASSIAYIHEDLFINDGKILSIRDSIIYKNRTENTTSYNEGTNTITITNKEALYRIKYFKNLKKDPIVYSVYIDGEQYCVSDKLPEIKWEIDYKKTKKIANYICYEATTLFRGSSIVAYFTKDLPYSTGPYKFEGLPGLILEVKEIGNSFNSWEAVSISHDVVNLAQNKKCQKPISVKEFLLIEEQKSDEKFRQKTSKLSPDVKITEMKVPRQGIEKKYEWE
jgi:GLPGLI family protein